MRNLLACLVIASASFAAAQEQQPAGEKITYEQHILPIFREKCGTCHNANDKNGDLALDNYAAAIQGGASGEVIKTDGDAENSKLYRVIAHLDEPFMPPEQPKLPDEQLALIKKWIELGALKDAGSTAKVKKANVARVMVSTDRPAGPPPLPENLPLDPPVVSSRPNGVTALAVNPWSPLAAVSGHKQVFLYHTGSLELIGVLPFPEGQPHVLKFSRNGQILMVAGGRGAHSGKVVLYDVKTGARMAEIGDEYDVVLGADLSPDQTLIALGGPKKMVRVYEVATGQKLYEMKKHTDWVTTLEFSPDGVLLATADRSNGLVIWEAGTGREFYSLTGHTAAITDVSWAPDSNTLATCSEDGTVKQWEMQNGGQIRNWNAHGGGATSLEFSRDARIATVGRDARGKVWDAGGNLQRQFEPALPDLGTAAVLCVETDRLLVGDLTGAIHVYNAKDGAKLGELSTNPPALATQITKTQEQVTQAEAAANQAAAQLAALNKGIADRKAAAEAAMKAAAEAKVAVDTATKVKTDADADLVVKQQAVATAETALKTADETKQKAAAETEAANKVLIEAQTASKQAGEASAVAEAKLLEAQKAANDKPDDAGLKQAAAAAAQAAVDALAVVTQTAAKRTEAVKGLAAKNDAQIAATAAYNGAKAAYEGAVAAQTASAKAATDAATAQQAALTLLTMKTQEAEKAVTAAQVTPELQQQVTAAEAAAKATADTVAALKGRLERQQAAINRPHPAPMTN
jgi:WD40 repeat protein